VSAPENRSLFEALLGDGRFLISLTGMALLASGVFAIAQSFSGQLLPHDVHALGMDAATLAHRANHRVLLFMFHDRVAFGGTLLAIGMAYWWLAEFPLREGAAWAWYALALSGACGFLSFLSYLGYGYLDTWHGVATLLLLPVYLAGMWRARAALRGQAAAVIWKPKRAPEQRLAAVGRSMLLFIGAGLVAAGMTILVVGMTSVFVPQDLAFMGVKRDELRALSAVLVPLIAHDRAGFGGGLLSFGVVLTMIMRHASLSRSLVELVFLMGFCGFGAALGVHFAIGYTDFVHLLPGYAGLAIFLAGAGFLASGLRSQRHFSAAA